MFDAKSHGLGMMIYDPVRHSTTLERLDVREALQRRELFVDYQPQFDLTSGAMTGAEALVRWRHPTRGVLAPDAFLGSFEKAGMMPDLTLQVLLLAVRDARRWRLDGTDPRISVNLSPSVLQHDTVVPTVLDIRARHGVCPKALTFEITEQLLMIDWQRSVQMLHHLSAQGIELSLDDYGTGYGSLTYVRDLPLTEVKIDKSFVTTLTSHSPDAVIVASTVQLAHALGLRTLAEGVETDAAIDLLRQLGCDGVQGNRLGPAVSAHLLPHTRHPMTIPEPSAPGRRPQSADTPGR